MAIDRERGVAMPTPRTQLDIYAGVYDEANAISPAAWDAMVDLMAYGTGVVRVGMDRAQPGADRTVWGAGVVRPEETRESARERHVRLWKRPMFTMKDGDPEITWDHKAMAARPFRERKD